MFKNFFIVVIIGSFCCFLFGIFNIYVEVEKNYCRMTYMFGQPQFSRVKFTENKPFPSYGLYYYYEGNVLKDVNVHKLYGSPVIFVPGNGGSYRQVRSLASIALRKGMDNDRNVHLDYFTIDYNEELSGLYGGYVEKQKDFLKICIQAVLRLYQYSHVMRRVVLIGHSMGGKVAQSVLMENDTANVTNTVIFLSTPLDKPVINFDSEMNAFYQKTNSYFSKNRALGCTNNETNIYSSFPQQIISNTGGLTELASTLSSVIFISIGGGNRDLLVPASLSRSKFSDIHSMTSSIPNVWLSCDHLSSVWCLQLMLVINRFLFSISTVDKNNHVVFNKNKTIRMQNAFSFFIKKRKMRPKLVEMEFLREPGFQKRWHVESKRIFRKEFKNGLKQNYNQLIDITKYTKFKKLYVEVSNMVERDWLYGCVVKTLTTGNHVCENIVSLSHYIQSTPAREYERSFVTVDLYNIRKTYLNWTHILLHLMPINQRVHFNVDIHDPAERYFHIQVPRWFSFNNKYLVNETVHGSIYYKLFISGLSEITHVVRINITPLACASEFYEVIVKVCIPWAQGFQRYYRITEETPNGNIYVSVPFSSPIDYNTTVNPVTVDIFLDTTCRYTISYQFSAAGASSRIVREFYQWLPSHLTAVLFIVLRNQISKCNAQGTQCYVKPYTAFFQYTSLYTITGCRVVKKLLTPVKFLPLTDISSHFVLVSIIIHSTAILLSILLSFAILTALMLKKYIICHLVLRFYKIPCAPSSILMVVVSHLPFSFAILSVAVALGSCSGIALIMACVVYFAMLSKAYEDYTENCVWKNVKDLIPMVSKSLKAKTTALICGGNGKSLCTRTDSAQNSNLIDPVHNHINAEGKDFGYLCESLDNFSIHITMFILLLITTSLNIFATLAWVRNYRNRHLMMLPDPSLLPSVVILVCLSLIWQLKIPTKRLGNRFISVILYASAAASIIYCQDELYRLNLLITFVYVIIVFQELCNRLWSVFTKKV